MAAAVAPTPPTRSRLQVVVREARRTPGTLTLALGAIWLLTLVTYLIARNGLIDARTAVQTIGRGDEPNVVNARQIASSLTDMHARVANALLLGFGEHSDDWDVYERQRQTVATALALVQQNNMAAEAVATSRQLAQDYGVYQDRIARAAEDQSQNFPVGMSYFREANDLMQAQLLPAADRLAQAGDSSLKDTFGGRVSNSAAASGGVVVVGLLLLVALVVTQLFLMLRMHRTVNLALLGATALAIVLIARTADALSTSADRLTAARNGPYATVLALTQARVLGYSANTDKSLWLLSQQDPLYQTSFDATTPRLAGLLSDSVKSLPPEQRQIGQAALADWANYLAIDAQLRQKDRSGDHAGAVSDATGAARSQSNGALAAFDQDISQLIDANQSSFDTRIQQLLEDLGGPLGAETMLPITAVLIAALTWFGLQPRISEYR